MSNSPEALLKRLDAIGSAVAESGKGLAVIGLGSVGIETDRIDEYSDLDFFVIAKNDCREFFLKNLNWMQDQCTIAWSFMNTADGYKALYQDGIFCEMAVFERHQLLDIPFAPGRIIWKDKSISDKIAIPKARKPGPSPITTKWLLGEALSNLYVGLCRYHRGEKISALRFIQSYAIDRVLDLTGRINPTDEYYPDTFDVNRRFEQRFPHMAKQLPNFLTGYSAIPESAKAILDFLELHFEVDKTICREIKNLCKPSLRKRSSADL